MATLFERSPSDDPASSELQIGLRLRGQWRPWELLGSREPSFPGALVQGPHKKAFSSSHGDTERDAYSLPVESGELDSSINERIGWNPATSK